MNAKAVPFDELAEADLIVDAVYLGGAANNAADDPLNKGTSPTGQYQLRGEFGGK